jgi:hypothetical protein
MRVENVSYQINWKAFRPGMSIFIPCLYPANALAEISKVMRRLKVSVVTKVVIQDGVQGVRIWRV